MFLDLIDLIVDLFVEIDLLLYFECLLDFVVFDSLLELEAELEV